MRFHRFHLTAVSALSLGLVVGCTSIDSTDIRTNGIHPSIQVHSNSASPGSLVSVALHVGQSITDFVELEGEDKLSVAAGEEDLELDENKALGIVTYTKGLTTQEPGVEVIVSLTRGPDDDSAPSSKVTLGEKLTLTTPATGAALSRADDDLVVTWESAASDDAVKVSVSGDCIQGQTLDIQAGTNTATFAKGSILKREQGENEEQPVPDSCDAEVKVSRVKAGELDPAFGGGSITHEYSARAEITTNL